MFVFAMCIQIGPVWYHGLTQHIKSMFHPSICSELHSPDSSSTAAISKALQEPL